MSSGASFRIEAASLTDVGLVRERNEDAFGERSWKGGRDRLFVVADGMGGHAGGAVASRLAVEAVEDALESTRGEPQTRIREAFEAANRRVHEASIRNSGLSGMGTTGVALLIINGAGWVANVGDSRGYRLRDGALQQLTRDHSVVAEMVRHGVITAAQAVVHPRRNEVLRSLGTGPEVDVDVDAVDIAEGDTYLLCSDGLSGVVDDAAIAALMRGASAEDACRALVEGAIGQGAPDNVTVQVIRVHAAR